MREADVDRSHQQVVEEVCVGRFLARCRRFHKLQKRPPSGRSLLSVRRREGVATSHARRRFLRGAADFSSGFRFSSAAYCFSFFPFGSRFELLRSEGWRKLRGGKKCAKCLGFVIHFLLNLGQWRLAT